MNILDHYLEEAKSDASEKLIELFTTKKKIDDTKDVHGLAEKLGIDPDKIEEIAYQFLVDFFSEGNFNKSGKKESDFDPKEIAMGMIVEEEHSSNKVFRKRITLDYLADNPHYYSDGKAGRLHLEELKK